MSYQVLARKWRPAKFEQVVGQSHVLHALTNALDQQRLHHAYLFTGTRGVGKTSLARLFAKGLNCEKGITASPCGECSSCIEISQGRFVDLIEVDAASRTKVDDTREILDNVQYRPTRGRFKVYLIDEVHMLSRSSFNALLKTLEEPPEHVKFLLATTDPQKLPITVLSRCLQFNLKILTQEDIAKQLNHVLEQEQLKFEPTALTLLAKAADGSMRDALSLTDQAIAFGAGEVMLGQVQTMLGSIDEQHVMGLLSALCTGDIAKLIPECHKVIGFGAAPEEVIRSLLELLHQITLTQFAPAAAQLSKFSEQIKAFSEQLSPEQVQLYYQILLTGRKELPYAPDPKSGLEMALLRAVAFVPQTPVEKWEVEEKKTLEIPLVEPKTTELPDQAIEADSKSVDSVKPIDTVSPDDEEGLKALEAEQSLLMSQAESHGFGERNVSEELLPPEAYEPEYDEPLSDGPEEQVVISSDTPALEFEQNSMISKIDVKPDIQTSKADSAPEVDDLLSAVLASNTDLLSDISNFEEDKDGDSKKSNSTFERRIPAIEKDTAKQEVTDVVSQNTEVVEDTAQSIDTPPWEDKVEPKEIVKSELGASATIVAEEVGFSNNKDVDNESSTEPLLEVKQLPSVISGNNVDLYWYKLMSELDFGGRIRQLAVNSVCQEVSEPLKLLLKPDQKHLAADIAIEQLEDIIEKHFERRIDVLVEVGVDKKRETPLEIRQRFQGELLNEAEQKLWTDPNVQWMAEQLGAKINKDTIAYPPTNLLDRNKLIENIEFRVPA